MIFIMVCLVLVLFMSVLSRLIPRPASHLEYITIYNTKCHRSEPSAGLKDVIAVTSYYDSYYCLANVFFHTSAYQI